MCHFFRIFSKSNLETPLDRNTAVLDTTRHTDENVAMLDNVHETFIRSNQSLAFQVNVM